MKYKYLLIYLLFFSKVLYSNEVEVIQLHEGKSLDQMVLENIADDEDNNLSDIQIEEDNLEESKSLETSEVLEGEEIENNNLGEIEIIDNDFFTTIETIKLDQYLLNSKNIKSEVLKNEYFEFLQGAQLNLKDEFSGEKIYKIVEYFYNIGEISKSYNMIKSNNLDNIEEHRDFYDSIKLNYLLSTFNLNEVCELNNNLSDEAKIDFFLIEKIDIFCLILQDKLSEAELLYSILLESESVTDLTYKNLYEILINNYSELDINNFKLEKVKNKNLIFLYSAMARIAEVPLSEDFLLYDKKNLAIPIILNLSSSIDLRIRAANESFLAGDISIESLAALYQSVDFNSEQLNNPSNMLENLQKNVELKLAYYYQLINVQIFPSERINVLLKFWNFANENNLEKIAYSLSYKILQSINLSNDFLNFSNEIAICYIFNKDYNNANKWIEFYEISNGVDEKSSFSRILLNLYDAENVDSIIEIINSNYSILYSSNDEIKKELLTILLHVLNDEKIRTNEESLEYIYDDRLMPSMYIIQNLTNSKESNNNNNILLFSTLSLNNKNWNEIHPEFIKLILLSYSKYNDGDLLKKIILEIINSYSILK